MSTYTSILAETLNLKYSMQQYFTNKSPRSRDIKERINKWDLIKIKSFCMAKENISKLKGKQLYGKIYLPMISGTRVLSPKYVNKSQDSTPGRQTIQLKMYKRP